MASNHLLYRYVARLREIRAGKRSTPELSYRSALEALFNDAGQDLRPRVTATAELADAGAGHPDFGLVEAKSGNLRCVVEVKPPSDVTSNTVDGRQVAKYWKQYGCVLVTNYRDFVLVVTDERGAPKVEHRFSLAPTEDEFWRMDVRKMVQESEEAISDFLVGAMTRSAPIRRPVDLADDLARHAREARRRLDRHDMSALAPLQTAMEETLGLHFSGDDGLHFFRSTLVQTLFYGLFSGWMLWRQDTGRSGAFDWRDASEYLALPLIGDLYEEIAKPRRLANLGLREPLEWATSSLARVDDASFFKDFDADHAITLFYEPFLEAFDPELRKQFGVWYTPPEIVAYMVARVDQLLRSELGIADGFADDRVYVLDPATGTGSFLVEIARTIQATLERQGHGALVASKVKSALTSRVIGFELLPAPYVIAHLQLGIFLRKSGARLASTERAEVYLTNSLTGWEPAKAPKTSLLFPELQREAERAGRVKHEKPILVVIGNPPYDRFAGVAEDEEADLIEPYKAGLYENWGVRKQLLDDLYVRFFRLAEKRIADVEGRGIVCYISNSRWLEGLSHVVMRERLAEGFDKVWIDNCNGDKYKTGKRTPDGGSDESMFTTDDHRVGIQVGTAIATFARRGPKSRGSAKVQYRDFWGTGNVKREQLRKSLTPRARGVPKYEAFTPTALRRWMFVPGAAAGSAYESWPSIPELFPVHYSGLNENRRGALLSVDADELEKRIKDYLNPKISDAQIAEECPGLMTNAASFNAAEVRRGYLKSQTKFDRKYLVRLSYRPLDDIWMYWMPEGKLINRRRPEFFEQVWPGNVFLSASQTGRKGGFNVPFVVGKLGDLHLQDPWSQFFPLHIQTRDLFGGDRPVPNVTPSILERLCDAFGVIPHTTDGENWSADAIAIAEELFFHVAATVRSPAYRAEHELSLQQDWARIPIPGSHAALKASARLGRDVAELLIPDRRVEGVTAGTLRPELRSIGVPCRKGGGQIDPRSDLKVDAGWGFHAQGSAVMAGQGRVEPSEGQTNGAVDVYINDSVYWSRVPREVWDATIGGFPVIKKWLSYREHQILGRALRSDEITYVTEMIRRLKALQTLEGALDSNYATVLAGGVSSTIRPAKGSPL